MCRNDIQLGCSKLSFWYIHIFPFYGVNLREISKIRIHAEMSRSISYGSELRFQNGRFSRLLKVFLKAIFTCNMLGLHQTGLCSHYMGLSSEYLSSYRYLIQFTGFRDRWFQFWRKLGDATHWDCLFCNSISFFEVIFQTGFKRGNSVPRKTFNSFKKVPSM